MNQRERYYRVEIQTPQGARSEVRSLKADIRRAMERGVGGPLSGRQWTKLRKAFRREQRAVLM